MFNYAISFPIALAKPLPDDTFLITGEIIGSCFSLGGKFMIAAGHVLEALNQPDTVGTVGLTSPSHSFIKSTRVVEQEKIPCDLGILQVEFVYEPSANWPHVLTWRQDILGPFESIKCLGYPYGLHAVEDLKSVVQRAFQGHIVAALREFKPLGIKENSFPAYELSFQAPRGLSGAPMFTSAGEFQIAGIVIGNSKSSMLIFETEEIEEISQAKTVVQHYESLNLGIAVQSSTILPLKSELLGDTIRGHLERIGKLVR